MNKTNINIVVWVTMWSTTSELVRSQKLAWHPMGPHRASGIQWRPSGTQLGPNLALNKAHVLALNTAHVLRLNKADVLALNKAHVMRLNTKICPVFIISPYHIIVSPYHIIISYHQITISYDGITISHHHITISYDHITISYHQITISHHRIAISHHHITRSYYHITRTHDHIKYHGHQASFQTTPGPPWGPRGLTSGPKSEIDT